MDSKEASSSPVSVNPSDVPHDTDSSYSRSNGKINSDYEGFVSGEEEFEAASEKPIDEKGLGIGGENSDNVPTSGSAVVPMPNDAKPSVSDGLVDDDVENDNKVEVLEGRKVVDDDDVENHDKVGDFEGRKVVVGDDAENDDKFGVLEGGKVPVQGDEGGVVNESIVAGDSSGSSTIAAGDDISINPDVSKESQAEEVSEKPEVSDSIGGLDLNLNGSVGEIQGGTFEGVGDKDGEVSKLVENASTVKDEEAGEGEADEKPVEADGLKFVPGGDTVVEATNVDVTAPGVAVVGEATELEAVKDRETEIPPAEDRTLLNASNAKSGIVGNDVADNSSISDSMNLKNLEGTAEMEIEQKDASKTVENGTVLNIDNHGKISAGEQHHSGDSVDEHAFIRSQDNEIEVCESGLPEDAEPKSVPDALELSGAGHGAKIQVEEEADLEDSISEGENDGMIFGSSDAAKQFIEELERGSGGDSLLSADSSHDHPQRIDGLVASDSEEEVDTDEEQQGKELFDSAALAALLKAASGADSDGGNVTITSQDGSRLFTVERPAGLGSSIRSLRPATRPNRPNYFAPPTLANSGDAENNLTDEEKKKLEKLQPIRVRFLRLVHRLGLSPDENVAAQVLYRLSMVAGRQSGQLYSIDNAKVMALQVESEKRDDLGFSLNILVLGKCGVGKSATINSIFGEERAQIDAFQPGTSTVKEITGFVDGVKIRVFDTPGLKSSVQEQSFNRSILSSVKKFTKKNPPDIVLYVDRLDARTRDLNDLPLLRTITSSLGSPIWRSAIVTLTHAASAPPDGPSGSPLSYEVFVTQRSHVVQQSIGQAVGDLRTMTPSMMNPVSLVENHPSCRKNREGHRVLPNGQSWRPQLLLLCYSIKILSEASSLSKPQDPFDHRKLFGFRVRSPPLPYMLSSILQSRPHPKLATEQGVDNGDSDVDLDDLSDIDNEEVDEYDQLPPFKPLRKAQIAKLSKEQRKAYFEEYDYRVKLLQKKQWKEELRRMRLMKTKGKDTAIEYDLMDEDADMGAAAPVAVPLPDMVLPPTFDCNNPAYRYRFLEPTSQFLVRPVLDAHGWDRDCGYDGVNVEHNLAVANLFPAAVTVQINKDKKDFTISLDSSISKKHGEKGSSMVGFDIQSIGKQLAYIVRGETKYKNLKNRTAGGVSITFLGENVIPGLKLEDRIALGKQYVLVGSAGAVRAQNDTACGANFELQRRDNDFPIGQVQSTFSMSAVRWRGDTALGFNGLTQISVGRNSKVAIRAGINNKMSGQITVRTSSSDHLSLALTALIPAAISIYKKLFPAESERYSMY